MLEQENREKESPDNSDYSSDSDYSPPLGSMVHNESDTHSVGTAVESETGFFASFSSPTTSFTEPMKDPPQSKWGRPVLPVPMFSRNDFSVWSILKQCIGRELSKITMPVVFNEPLSFLQRLSENMEYCYLLEKADQCEDPVKRMEYVAAFAVAAISSNWERLGKPFNPLLGETYELVREDMGFRIVCEQVSHHPPVSAFYADSAHFTFTGAIHPKLKLWARSVEIKPEGTVTVQLRKQNEVYTWSGVTCCVHNIIVGKLWIEQCGTMEIICHSNGLCASLNFKPAGWFGKDLNCVEGFITDRQKSKLRFIFGKWCTALRSADASLYEEYIRLKDQKPTAANNSTDGVSSNRNVNRDSSNSSSQSTEKTNGPLVEACGDGTNTETFPSSYIPSSLIWKADLRPEYSTDYYHFTLFAMALNELQEGLDSRLPRTDSRLRPDIRQLEEGDLDKAAEEKSRLEEKQREARKIRKKEKSSWEPMWFVSRQHKYAKEETWCYRGGYWERNFANCPDIF